MISASLKSNQIKSNQIKSNQIKLYLKPSSISTGSKRDAFKPQNRTVANFSLRSGCFIVVVVVVVVGGSGGGGSGGLWGGGGRECTVELATTNWTGKRKKN